MSVCIVGVWQVYVVCVLWGCGMWGTVCVCMVRVWCVCVWCLCVMCACVVGMWHVWVQGVCVCWGGMVCAYVSVCGVCVCVVGVWCVYIGLSSTIACSSELGPRPIWRSVWLRISTKCQGLQQREFSQR